MTTSLCSKYQISFSDLSYINLVECYVNGVIKVAIYSLEKLQHLKTQYIDLSICKILWNHKTSQLRILLFARKQRKF